MKMCVCVWGGGIDAVCIVQWISGLIVTLEGCAKKKCKKKAGDGEDKGRVKWHNKPTSLNYLK